MSLLYVSAGNCHDASDGSKLLKAERPSVVVLLMDKAYKDEKMRAVEVESKGEVVV